MATTDLKKESVSPKATESTKPRGRCDTQPTEREKKKQTFIVRTIWTLIMIAGMVLVLTAGHIWMVALVGLIQVLAFREVIMLATEPAREMKLPWVRSLNWYFLATTIYYLEGESVIYYFETPCCGWQSAAPTCCAPPLSLLLP